MPCPLAPRLLGDLFHADEVLHLGDHAADLRAVVLDHDVADPMQPETPHGVLLVLGPIDHGPDLRDLQLHATLRSAEPRVSATASLFERTSFIAGPSRAPAPPAPG